VVVIAWRCILVTTCHGHVFVQYLCNKNKKEIVNLTSIEAVRVQVAVGEPGKPAWVGAEIHLQQDI